MIISRDTQVRMLYDELHWFYDNCVIIELNSDDIKRFQFKTRKMIDRLCYSYNNPETIKEIEGNLLKLKEEFYKRARLYRWDD